MLSVVIAGRDFDRLDFQGEGVLFHTVEKPTQSREIAKGIDPALECDVIVGIMFPLRFD